MAMNLGSKCVRRLASARRFVAGRGGGDLESSTGLARASQIVRFYGTCSESFHEDPTDWFFYSNTGRLCLASVVGTFIWAKYLLILYDKKESVRISILESDIALRRAIEEKGITREMCKAKKAQLKQKTESSEHDRLVLQIIQGWLRVLPKDKSGADKSGAVGRGGSRILPLEGFAASQSSTQHGFLKSGK